MLINCHEAGRFVTALEYVGNCIGVDAKGKKIYTRNAWLIHERNISINTIVSEKYLKRMDNYNPTPEEELELMGDLIIYGAAKK